MAYLFDAPTQLQLLIAAGKAVVEGVLVKSPASGKILGHLQQSGLLTQLLGSAGPVSAASAVGSAASSVAANVQLEQVKSKLGELSSLMDQMLEGQRTLQMLAGIGTAASVLNVGVSLGGFALVYRQLKRIDTKLDALGETVEALFAREHRLNAHNALRRSLEAFQKADHGRRREILLVEERHLDAETEFFFRALFGDSLDHGEEMAELLRTQHLLVPGARWDATVSAFTWLLALSSARLEALLLLNDADGAEHFAQVLAERFAHLPASPRELADARIDGRPVSLNTLAAISDQSSRMTRFLEDTREQTAQRSATLRFLRQSGVSTEAYVEEVSNHPAPALLAFLPDDARA